VAKGALVVRMCAQGAVSVRMGVQGLVVDLKELRMLGCGLNVQRL
jgi:hypothetical protein